MNYGISNLSIIPVRKEPSERSEMLTQILFGEHFELREQIMGWTNVKLEFDGYEGWVDSKMITPILERAKRKIENSPMAVTSDVITIVPVNDEQNLMLVAGSSLPVWRPYLKQFSVTRDTYLATGEVVYGDLKNPREIAITQALKYFNAPYLWGGRTPFGVDCSGLTQIIYKMIGIKIPRDASEQVKIGRALSFVDEAKPGDLAFFDDEEGNIVHVGIMWKRNKIIHASGQVRIDNVDQFGIFNIDTQRYTHKMRVMKQIIESNGTD
ncbi:MAG: C40 family peptidase [Bacteroidetes bacterium]|nr:C40 family peptidase [Bacteroidota bacterium]